MWIDPIPPAPIIASLNGSGLFIGFSSESTVKN
jgi:hypothetical protein